MNYSEIKGIYEKKFEITRWYLDFRFPFIHKSTVFASTKELQEIVNNLINQALENRAKSVFPPYIK